MPAKSSSREPGREILGKGEGQRMRRTDSTVESGRGGIGRSLEVIGYHG